MCLRHLVFGQPSFFLLHRESIKQTKLTKTLRLDLLPPPTMAASEPIHWTHSGWMAGSRFPRQRRATTLNSLFKCAYLTSTCLLLRLSTDLNRGGPSPGNFPVDAVAKQKEFLEVQSVILHVTRRTGSQFNFFLPPPRKGIIINI